MRKAVLYIAMSIDGYIADGNGGVGWLNGQDATVQTEDTYSEFAKGIDTVVMGWTTFHQIVTELSPSQWIYDDLTSYIITHRQEASTEKIIFVHDSPAELIKRLKEQNGKDIWICGGANIVQQLLQVNLIDIFYISIIPTLVGKGIRLFETLQEEMKLKLIKTKSYNGIVEVIYEKR